MSFKFSLIAILITIYVPILNIDFISLKMEVITFSWNYMGLYILKCLGKTAKWLLIYFHIVFSNYHL